MAKTKRDVKVDQDNELTKQDQPKPSNINRTASVLDTTVKIVSSFSDMITSWKEKKVKRIKRKIFIWVGIIFFLLFIGLAVVVVLLVLKKI